MMRAFRIMLFLVPFLVQLCGCVLTKVATVPMRMGGAAVSIVPGVGNTVDAAIDGAADLVDEVPL